MAYMGHGGPGALYLGFPNNDDANLTPYGGPGGDPDQGCTHSTSVDMLPTENVKADATADLFACNSASSMSSVQSNTSMTQAFAHHFGIPVQGAGAGVGFNKGGPYIRGWRIVNGWRERLFRGLNHGGGWQIWDPNVYEF